MSDARLEESIERICRKSIEGIIVNRGYISDMDRFYDEEYIYGDEVLIALKYKDYVDELNRRKKVE